MSETGLGREIGKRNPFSSLEEELLLNLLRTHDQVQIHFLRLFRVHGLTPSQYNILRILRGEGQPLPCLEVAARLITVVPGITGLIDRLERMELVQRHRCESDRRVIYVAILEKGRKLLEQIDPHLVALHKQLFEPLDDSEKRELIRLLEKARVRAQQLASTD
jgi:DNA-binding MarR family transcriptional regulator